MNFFNYNNRERELTQLCLCGGGSAVQPLYDTIADTTGMTLHTSAELLGQRMSTEGSRGCTCGPSAWILASRGACDNGRKDEKGAFGGRSQDLLKCPISRASI